MIITRERESILRKKNDNNCSLRDLRESSSSCLHEWKWKLYEQQQKSQTAWERTLKASQLTCICKFSSLQQTIRSGFCFRLYAMLFLFQFKFHILNVNTRLFVRSSRRDRDIFFCSLFSVLFFSALGCWISFAPFFFLLVLPSVYTKQTENLWWCKRSKRRWEEETESFENEVRKNHFLQNYYWTQDFGGSSWKLSPALINLLWNL